MLSKAKSRLGMDNDSLGGAELLPKMYGIKCERERQQRVKRWVTDIFGTKTVSLRTITDLVIREQGMLLLIF